jgi:hypothetical protein
MHCSTCKLAIAVIIAAIAFCCSGIYPQNGSSTSSINLADFSDSSENHDSRFSLPDPNYSRLIIAPTGKPLHQGTGFVADTWLFFPSVSYGITNNITMMAGMSIFPFGGLSDQLLYVAPKFGLQLKKGLDLSVGAIYIYLPEAFFLDEGAAFGITYAVATWGKEDYNFTGGVGFGYYKEGNDHFHFGKNPAIILGGYLRTTEGSALILESWVAPYEGFDLRNQPVGLAVRMFNEHIVVDAGIFGNFFRLKDAQILPWLGAAYNFGSKH